MTADEIEAALAALQDNARCVRAMDWPADAESIDTAGLYSWWITGSGARDLSAGLDLRVRQGLIYAGQAGATKWPSGRVGAATLTSRISRNHLRGRIRASTFRLTLAAVLRASLELAHTGSRRLDAESEQRLSEWMRQHLSVAVYPFPDRGTLGAIETAVLRRLDPPLNLDGMPPTPLRVKLRKLRAALGRTDGAEPQAPRKRASRTPREPKSSSRDQPTLHDEIASILRANRNRWMTTQELSAAVNERGRYTKKDGSPVTAFQIHGRTRNYSDMFERDALRVRLRR